VRNLTMISVFSRDRVAFVALAASVALALAGCASTTLVAPAGPVSAAQSVTLSDAWVKAADEGMTAAFGVLSNRGPADVTLVAASGAAAASMELHETVGDGSGGMVMRERDGGFTVPAGGALTLEPGGDHVMLLGLSAPIVAGDEVELVLVFSDGSEL